MKTYKKLIKSREQYECAISSLEQELESKIDFDFFIVYQQSDCCHMVVYDFESKYHGFSVPGNAPVKDVIDFIKDHGKLTLEDYKALCI